MLEIACLTDLKHLLGPQGCYSYGNNGGEGSRRKSEGQKIFLTVGLVLRVCVCV